MASKQRTGSLALEESDQPLATLPSSNGTIRSDADYDQPEPDQGKRFPTWVFLLLLGFLVFILLGVESILNWLLPTG